MPYFDEPAGRVKIQTTIRNTQRYYTPKRLISYLLSDCFSSAASFCSFLMRREKQSGQRSVAPAADWLNRFFYRTKYPTAEITVHYRRLFVFYFVQLSNNKGYDLSCFIQKRAKNQSGRQTSWQTTQYRTSTKDF